MPIIETYRGVGIHDFQDAERIATIVKPAIDEVFENNDPQSLFDYACDPANPPEARLFAGDKYLAAQEMRADAHDRRHGGGAERLAAALAGLDSLEWADPSRIGTLLQPRRPGVRDDRDRRPAEQERRLEAARATLRRRPAADS